MATTHHSHTARSSSSSIAVLFTDNTRACQPSRFIVLQPSDVSGNALPTLLLHYKTHAYQSRSIVFLPSAVSGNIVSVLATRTQYSQQFGHHARALICFPLGKKGYSPLDHNSPSSSEKAKSDLLTLWNHFTKPFQLELCEPYLA